MLHFIYVALYTWLEILDLQNNKHLASGRYGRLFLPLDQACQIQFLRDEVKLRGSHPTYLNFPIFFPMRIASLCPVRYRISMRFCDNGARMVDL